MNRYRRGCVIMVLGITSASVAAERVNAVASQRMEACLHAAAFVSAEDATNMACPVTGASPAARTANREVTRESALLVLRRLNASDEPGLCLQKAKDVSPATSALCALLSNEQFYLATAPQRHASRGVARYQPVRVSVGSLDRYVDHVLQAASAKGFAELSAAIGVTLHQDVQDEIHRRELSGLQQQADYLASVFEGTAASGFRAVAVEHEDGVSSAMGASVFSIMAGSALQPSTAAALPLLLSTSTRVRSKADVSADAAPVLSAAHRHLVESWAVDAAAQYRVHAREIITRSGIAEAGTVAMERTEQYVAQVMYEVTKRAGHCAIACAAGGLQQDSVAIPIPVRADLLVPIQISP